MNYTDLKALVQQYLECSETTFNTNIDTFIQLAEEDIYRSVQLPDLVQTATSNCITNSPYIPLPQDFLSQYYLAVIVNGSYQMLLSKDHTFIREVYPDQTATGVPRFFAVFNENALIVGPTPDQDYPVELNYFYFPPSLTVGDGSQTTWVSENAEQAMLFGTILQGYIYLKGDQDVIKMYSDRYQNALAQLKTIAEGRDRKDSYRKSDRRLPV